MAINISNLPALDNNEGGLNPEIEQITADSDLIMHESIDLVPDRNWSKSAFIIGDKAFQNKFDKANLYWSSAATKFTDTRLGCNIGVNARPQFTRYADVRVPGRLAGRNEVTLTATTGNHGMGRYYSEAIDDPSQTIFMEFGVPQFNSLTNFLANAYDPELVAIAKTGRGTDNWYKLGSVIPVILFPAISLPVAAGLALNAIFLRPTSKFYTLKSTMFQYWSAVNNIANVLAANSGIYPKISNNGAAKDKPFSFDSDYLNQLSSLMPDVFNNGYFDIYSLANRGMVLKNAVDANDFASQNNSSSTDYLGFVQKDLTDGGSKTNNGGLVSRLGNSVKTLAQRLNEVTKIGNYKANNVNNSLEINPQATHEGEEGFFESLKKHFDSDTRDGAKYAVFKVDYTGSVSSSFSNSTTESDLGKKINNVSSQMREARFSFADGNIGAGVVGELVTDALGAVSSLATGALNTVTMGFGGLISGLGGSGYIEIPKHWQSSSANLPRSTYTMQLITPYGNAVSRMINIYIPLSMILAAALPIQTGKQSYTSPFLCKLFDKGRCQISLGMIEQLSITVGTSNLGFTASGQPLSIDVSFSVVDLSTIMSMPLLSGPLDTLTGTISNTLDEDQTLSNYLSIIAGQDLYSMTYPTANPSLALAKKMIAYRTLQSPAYWSQLIEDKTTSGIFKYLTLGSVNVLEATNRGNTLLTR